jgi:hypothetical protein
MLAHAMQRTQQISEARELVRGRRGRPLTAPRRRARAVVARCRARPFRQYFAVYTSPVPAKDSPSAQMLKKFPLPSVVVSE